MKHFSFEGLPQERLSQASKTQKKRKKKAKSKVLEKSNSEDSSVVFELDVESAPAPAPSHAQPEPSPAPDTEQEAEAEQVYELQLTDDLADCLVNPPTEPEAVEEEQCPASPWDPPPPQIFFGTLPFILINSDLIPIFDLKSNQLQF